MVDALRSRGFVATVTPYATEYVRLGPSIVNSPAENDRMVRAIAALYPRPAVVALGAARVTTSGHLPRFSKTVSG